MAVWARQLSVAWGSTTAERLTRDERAGLAITDAANETITWTKNGEAVDAVSDVGVAVGSTDVYKASAGTQTATDCAFRCTEHANNRCCRSWARIAVAFVDVR